MHRTHPPTYPSRYQPHPEEPSGWKDIAMRVVVLVSVFALVVCGLMVLV